jgi:hypothetical protein
MTPSPVIVIGNLEDFFFSLSPKCLFPQAVSVSTIEILILEGESLVENMWTISLVGM